MKKAWGALATLAVLAGGTLTYRTIDACSASQERYKRFLYVEMSGHSPIVYSAPMIEAIVGERPFGCDRPGTILTDADLSRFRRDPVDFDEFLHETRSAYRRTDGFRDL